MSNDFEATHTDTNFGEVSSDERTWAMLAHLSILVFIIFGPLIIWLVKKEGSAFIDDQAKEALNFQLAVTIAVFILSATCIGAVVAIPLSVVALVFGVIAGIEANKGVAYRYKYTFRIIK